jgi:hypothetical protein
LKASDLASKMTRATGAYPPVRGAYARSTAGMTAPNDRKECHGSRRGACGINLRGLSASVVGSQFIAYVGVDSPDDVMKAIDILGRV